MKIYINTKLNSGASGGGNQFLRALKVQLTKEEMYAETALEADAVIFNGYQELGAIFSHWLLHNKQKIIYRLGPILSLHRQGMKWLMIDYIVVSCANIFANKVIFQSAWSYKKALEQGLNHEKAHRIILNGVDENIFWKKQFREKSASEKIKLVYTSWSSNLKKGFKCLRYLDGNLDFNKYELTFIGNSPFEFRNIKTLKPLPSMELAEELRKNDIFVSPVEDDACSNALLEALASGLPAVALDSGGNPELVNEGGELFMNESELLEKIEKVADNLRSYHDKIAIESMKKVAGEYLNAIEN